MTERGIELLQALLRDFGPEHAGSKAEFFTRVSFFDFLDIPERQAILRERLGYLHSLQRLAEEGEECADIVPTQTHARRVLAFHTRRIHDEYEWIGTWLEELQANVSS